MSDSAAISSISGAQMDYMQLLVTELQNQNPLEPMDNSEMASQLAQFSQLQELGSMNSRFAKVLATIERAYATSLIGKEISFMRETEDGAEKVTSGIVKEVGRDTEGEACLIVGDRAIGIENVVSVKK